MQNGRFPCKIALCSKKVCCEVSLCENRQRQSCKAFTRLPNRAKMDRGGVVPYYVKNWPKRTNHLHNRACERSGKRSGATRKSGGAERSGERAWEKNDGAERSAEREVAEQERSVERVELAAHSPLQLNISLIL